MTSEVMLALTAVSSASVFFGVLGHRIAVGDDPVWDVLVWIVPAFLVTMGYAGACLGVFLPAVRSVATLVT